MKLDWMLKALLLLITVFVGLIAIRSFTQPAPVLAQGSGVHPFYAEPGTAMLRKPDGTAQLYGKVMIDMATGEVWGFPTGTADPYPSNPASTTPPKSHPFYLGRFELGEAVRR